MVVRYTSIILALLLVIPVGQAADLGEEDPDPYADGTYLEDCQEEEAATFAPLAGSPIGDQTFTETTRIQGGHLTLAGHILVEGGGDLCIEAESLTLLPGSSLCTEAAPDQRATMSDDYELVGADGVDAGGIYILLEGAASEFKVNPGAIICTGDGGAGGTAIHTVPDLTHVQTCQDLDDALLHGGTGGDAGLLSISAPSDAHFDVAPASVLLGQGGTGGHALLVGTAYSASTFGGAGGESRALLNDEPLPLEWAGQGHGGDGGNAVSSVCSMGLVDLELSLSVADPMSTGLLSASPDGGSDEVESVLQPASGVDDIDCTDLEEEKLDCIVEMLGPECNGAIGNLCPIGENGADAHASGSTGQHGNNGLPGNDASSDASYTVGATITKGPPGISASVSCPPDNEAAEPGGTPTAGSDGGYAISQGGNGSYGLVQGGKGGSASSEGGQGGNGGIGGDGGAAAVEYFTFCLFQKMPAAIGADGSPGGPGGRVEAAGGNGGPSEVFGGDGGDAIGRAASGGKGGDGGNGGDSDSDYGCIPQPGGAVLCTTVVASQGRFGCGGPGGPISTMDVSGGEGGDSAINHGGDTGKPFKDAESAQRGADGAPGAGRPRGCEGTAGTEEGTEAHDGLHMAAFDDPDFYTFETIHMEDPNDGIWRQVDDAVALYEEIEADLMEDIDETQKRISGDIDDLTTEATYKVTEIGDMVDDEAIYLQEDFWREHDNAMAMSQEMQDDLEADLDEMEADAYRTKAEAEADVAAQQAEAQAEANRQINDLTKMAEAAPGEIDASLNEAKAELLYTGDQIKETITGGEEPGDWAEGQVDAAIAVYEETEADAMYQVDQTMSQFTGGDDPEDFAWKQYEDASEQVNPDVDGYNEDLEKLLQQFGGIGNPLSLLDYWSQILNSERTNPFSNTY